MDSTKPQNTLDNNNSPQKEWDTSMQSMHWWDKNKAVQAKVMVVGAGALGNEVLKNLTLLNFGHILLVDFDHIEYPNLSRSVLFRESDVDQPKCDVAAKSIRQINPNVKVKTLNGNVSIDVGLGVFKRMDVIISCVDNRMARLFINRACNKVDKIWIDGGIQDLGGQLHVYKPGKTCYECGLSKYDRAFLKNRASCPNIAFVREKQGSITTTPISASLIGALQAQEALKVVMGEENLLMTDRFFYFQGRSNEVLLRNYFKLKDSCYSHYTYEDVKQSPLRSDMKISEALAWLAEHFNDTAPDIALDNQLVLEITTADSEIATEVFIPKPHLTNEVIKSYQKTDKEQLVLSKMVQTLNAQFPYQDKTLAECGIPPLHIIKVLTETAAHYVELSGDEDYLDFK